MDTKWAKLCVFLILCSEFCCWTVSAATVSASFSPSPAIKGSRQQHTVRCDFTITEPEWFRFLRLKYTGGIELARLSTDGTYLWFGDGLDSRGYLQGSKDEGYLSMVLNDTLCTDNNNGYTCVLAYRSPSNTFLATEDATTIQVEAPPLAPDAMKTDPTSENVTEYTEVMFSCRGNVGRPAGAFHWYTFVGTESGTGQNRTDQALQLAATPASGDDNCTFERMSTLTLNLSRTEGNKKLVVRCRVSQNHGNSDVSACTNPDTDFCRMSPQINVQYPVSASVMSDTMTREEGTDVNIDCNTDGNPPPYLVEWQKQGENETTVGRTLTLNQLTLNNTGTYVCTAYNIIAGVTRSASVSVSLTVEKTTTLPPTTTPLVTTPESTTKKDDGGDGGTVPRTV